MLAEDGFRAAMPSYVGALRNSELAIIRNGVMRRGERVSRLDTRLVDPEDPEDRSQYKVVLHREFSRARDKLDPTVRATAEAAFHEFVRLWKSGTSRQELHPRFDYK